MPHPIAVADALSAPDPAPLPLRLLWQDYAIRRVLAWHDRLEKAVATEPSARLVLERLKRLSSRAVGNALNAPLPLWCLTQQDGRLAVAGAALAACDAEAANGLVWHAELASIARPLGSKLLLQTSGRWLNTDGAGGHASCPSDGVPFGGDTVRLAHLDSKLGGDLIDSHPKLSGPTTTDAFREDLTQALEMLQSSAPGFARSLQGFVRVTIPMQAPARGVPSASTNAVPGAACLTATSDPCLLAEQFTHESAHALLFLLQEADPLLDPAHHGDGWGEPVLYSPWRDDLRPLNGLLHGAVVFLRVAWMHARLADRYPSAARRLSALGPQIRSALKCLRQDARLTPTGERLRRGLEASEAMLGDLRREWSGEGMDPLYVECSSILDMTGDGASRHTTHQRRIPRGATER